MGALSAPKLEIVVRPTCGTKYNAKKSSWTRLISNDTSLHQAALDRAAAAHGRLDLALICQGNLPDQSVCEQDLVVLEQEFVTNCFGPISILTVLANCFALYGCGCIAAISSVAGDRGRQSNYVYGTAKAALSTFLAGLRNRLYPKGVRVLTIKPGFVDTPMTAKLKKGPLFAIAGKSGQGHHPRG